MSELFVFFKANETNIGPNFSEGLDPLVQTYDLIIWGRHSKLRKAGPTIVAAFLRVDSMRTLDGAWGFKSRTPRGRLLQL